MLSRSTVKADLEEKPLEFLRLPSAEAYIVFAQQETKAWVWTREERSFPAEPRTILGQHEIVRVPAINLSLPLAEVYEGVVFGT